MTDGVLNIKKEKGMTSFAVVYKLKKLLKADKIGHTGTLDPDATGVLPICMGKATKLVGRLTDSDKTYKAVMLLGRKTDTQDISGKTIEEVSADRVRETMDFLSGESKDTLGYKHALHKIESAFALLTGTIEQLPPMYSALKVNGVKLVDAARMGKEIERKPREITIYGFSNIDYSEDGVHISFEVNCSKGTYVRTICQDIGDMLGLPACLESLERTKASGLTIDESITLKEAEMLLESGELESHIIPIDAFLKTYEALTINFNAVKKIAVGNFLYPEDLLDSKLEEKIYRMYDINGKFYALYRYFANEGVLKAEKMFV